MNVNRSNKSKWFYIKKRKKKGQIRRYLAETITDAHYPYGLVFLVNTPVQAESLLHSLEQAARGIRINMNT